MNPQHVVSIVEGGGGEGPAMAITCTWPLTDSDGDIVRIERVIAEALERVAPGDLGYLIFEILRWLRISEGWRTEIRSDRHMVHWLQKLESLVNSYKDQA